MSISDREFRDALGRFATGVCVVSAFSKDDYAIGMTINSFASVSLDPKQVLWSLKHNAVTYGMFSSVHEYSISILAAHQKDLSNRYAKPGDHALSSGDFLVSERGIPFIREALAVFECASDQVVPAGDHDVLIANVTHYQCRSDRAPLLFYSGRYLDLATEMAAGRKSQAVGA
ncbi:MAG: flavin reductase family protein [Pseudomonadota bacterium]|nr:flavin reductase family protein [Pseudomonadota bacterium]